MKYKNILIAVLLIQFIQLFQFLLFTSNSFAQGNVPAAGYGSSYNKGSDSNYQVTVKDYNGTSHAPPPMDYDEDEEVYDTGSLRKELSAAQGNNNFDTRADWGKGGLAKDAVPYGGDEYSGAQPSATGSAGVKGRVEANVPHRKCLKLDPTTGKGNDVIGRFNFPDADIIQVAEALGRLTCLNFIYDKDVKGRISIVSNSDVTTGDAWRAFLSGLDANSYSIVPSGKFLRIIRQVNAKDKQIRTYTGDNSPDTDMLITRLVPLKQVSAAEVQRVLLNFIPPYARLVAHEASNTLIITDTGANVKKLVSMIQILDVEKADEKISVVNLQYASATEVARLISQLLPSAGNGGPLGAMGIGGTYNSFQPGFSGAGKGSGSYLSGVRKSKEGGVISQVIPDERTNSIIVSANDRGLKEVKELVSKLDNKVKPSPGGAKISVIYLKYADAEEVVKSLTGLVSGGGGSQSAASSPLAGGLAGLRGAGAIFESAVKLSADKATNSVVVTGSASDFATIQQVVSKLDISRDQVFVETIIMETTVDKKFDASVGFVAPGLPGGFIPNTDMAQAILNPLSLPGIALGFHDNNGRSKTFTLPDNQTVTVQSFQALVRFLLRNTKSNLLATPQLLTMDNQEATIEIAEEIPLLSVTTNQSVSQQSVNYRKVALVLKIKPQINKESKYVKLDIDQKLEDIGTRQPPRALQDLAFSTSSRAAKTTVVVHDGDTVAIGGLVRDKVEEVSTKVPLLGDLPLIGWLFRSKSSSVTKQNLLVFITPRIVNQYEKVRNILEDKIRDRDQFLQKYFGGEDPFEQQKSKMLKSLPPLAEIQQTGDALPTDSEQEAVAQAETGDVPSKGESKDSAKHSGL